MSAPALASALAIALTLGLTTACVTAQAPPDSPLAAQWRLDAGESDNLEAKLNQAIDRAQARVRKERQHYAAMRARSGIADNGDESSLASDQFGSAVLLAPDFKQLRSVLLQILGAPPSLSISVQPDVVTIQRGGYPARDYQPGESFVLFDEYGNGTVKSGWSEKAFVIRQNYMGRGSLTERYEVDPKSGALIYTRSLKDSTVGPMELKSVYHRA